MSLTDITSASINDAINEFDRLGRAAFLKKYGFGRAREFYLAHEGRVYDSKAIAGAAHGFARSKALRANEFSGGEGAAAGRLRALGFTVLKIARKDRKVDASSEDPLVLVENEVTVGARYDSWKDVTGERYHFPNQYRNRVFEGRKFVYYRGTRRVSGQRGTPEYFGVGTVGQVWQDPETHRAIPSSKRHWFAEVQDYRAFPRAVPAKYNGKYLEKIPQNFWGVGVRVLPRETYNRILELSGLPTTSPEIVAVPERKIQPEIVSGAEALLVPRMGRVHIGKPNQYRRSRHSKAVGDQAERVIFNMLEKTLSPSERSSLRWVAKEGEQPGWDLQYGEDPNLTAIEMKGTKGAKFPTLEITANEWIAAEALRQRYWLYLVADCLSLRPRIQILQDPFGKVSAGTYSVAPLVWRFSL
jgi:Domain of unknown function (DUF3883)